MVADFNKKQKSEFSGNKIVLQMAAVLFLIIVVILVFANFKMYQKRKELVSQIDNYEKQIAEIKKSSQKLKIT